MTLLRALWPALVGLILLLFGFQSAVGGIKSGDDGSFANGLRTAVIPTAIGIGLLLASVAIARRTRLGYLLGVAVGVLGVAAGLGLILLEIPFLQKGGESAAFGGGFVIVAAIWSLLWLLYAWRASKARTSFALAWVPADRRLAIVLAAIAIVGTGLFLGIGALQTNANANAIETDAQARTVVGATGFRVFVLNADITPASGGKPAVVDHLNLQIELESQQAYALAVPPTLCLTSLAMFQDPAYKFGMLCWGLPGPDDSLRFSLSSTVPQDTTTLMLDLRGAGSPCPFSPGTWNAELTLAPSIDPGTDGIGPAPGLYSISATFQVGDGSVAPPPSGSPDASEGCLGISP